MRKGFTIIELLVVVSIIDAIFVVGVAAIAVAVIAVIIDIVALSWSCSSYSLAVNSRIQPKQAKVVSPMAC